MDHDLLFLSFADRHQLPLSALVNNASVNTGLYKCLSESLLSVFGEHISRSGAAGSHGSCVSNCLRGLRTEVHSGHTVLQSHHRGPKFQFLTSLPACVIFWVFLFFNKVAICVSSLEKCLFSSLPILSQFARFFIVC